MKSKKRFLFLDILRGIAVIEMINGHSLDALLSLSQKSSLFYQIWMHVRGYTAPLFLFASGISFALSTIDRKEYLIFSEKLYTRIKRLIFVIFLGYTLHLPYFSLRKILLYSTPYDLNNFFNVDILQCIGVSLLILQFFYFITKREKIFLITNFLLIFIFSMLSFIIKRGFEVPLPLFFYKYFKNSNFPLTPFSIYLFSGVFLGYLVKKKENKNFYFIIFALINFSIYLLLKKFTNYIASIYFKIFNLTLLSLILYQLENKENKFLNIIKIVGIESLLVYYSHLLVVYGSAFNKTSLKSLFSGTLSFFQIYLVIFTLIFLFSLIALFWNYLKRERKNLSNVIKYSIYLYFLLNLLLRPY